MKVGRLNASEGQEAGGGIVETRVDLRATGLSADKLQEFLNLIENSLRRYLFGAYRLHALTKKTWSMLR